MKNFDQIERFLFPHVYRRIGFLLIGVGVPMIFLVMTTLVLNRESAVVMSYWHEWSGYLLHMPISLGLFWVLFAAEQHEDEMFLSMRLKATFHGIRFAFIAVLFLPIISIISAWVFGNELKTIDVGGNLAVVSLLLLYANISYWYLKSKALKDEE